MGLFVSPELADTLSGSFTGARKTATTTPAVAQVGGSNQVGRQTVYLHNTSTSNTLYAGPSGASPTTYAVPIGPGEGQRFDFRETIDLYVMTDTGTLDYIVWEVS